MKASEALGPVIPIRDKVIWPPDLWLNQQSFLGPAYSSTPAFSYFVGQLAFGHFDATAAAMWAD